MRILILLFPFLLNAQTIKVLTIDTGLDLSHDFINQHVKELPDENYKDEIGHGTFVAGMILKDTCPEVEYISCRFLFTFKDSNEIRMERIYKCFERARTLKVDFINYSVSGKTPDEKEPLLIAKLSKRTKVIAAAGNENLDLSKEEAYLASYNLANVIIVGNLWYPFIKHPTSNYNYPGMVWELGTNIESTLPQNKTGYMTGTSMATAAHTNRLIKKKCKEIHK